MAIKNNICSSCDHQHVCSKLTTLKKFDDDEKSFIGMDIKIELCRDFLDTDTKENSSEGNE